VTSDIKTKKHGGAVSIKAKDNTPWFALEMTNNNLLGISVVLDH
jgi:hypothetical protein